MTAQDTPGVVAPPPLIFVGFLLAAFALDALAPLALRPGGIDAMVGWWAGGLLVLLGVITFVLGIGNFVRAGTPVPTREATRALVITGVHALSRNPIYVAMFLMYLGGGVLANTVWSLVLFVPLALLMRYGVVGREEAYLERKFGDAYRAYKTRVPRWL
jgi:protein-S-isoprenylcysteine O-methyltransferase Ste14